MEMAVFFDAVWARLGASNVISTRGHWMHQEVRKQGFGRRLTHILNLVCGLTMIFRVGWFSKFRCRASGRTSSTTCSSGTSCGMSSRTSRSSRWPLWATDGKRTATATPAPASSTAAPGRAPRSWPSSCARGGCPARPTTQDSKTLSEWPSREAIQMCREFHVNMLLAISA